MQEIDDKIDKIAAIRMQYIIRKSGRFSARRTTRIQEMQVDSYSRADCN